ncbi:MAG: hypothetical protein ABI579_08895, partial [Candidatus Sumerlaeota bacterium]
MSPSGNAFISEADFRALWAASQIIPESATQGAAYLIDTSFAGRVTESGTTIEADLKLLLVNSGATPASFAYPMKSMTVGSWQSSPPGVTVVPDDQGVYTLALPADWRGTITAKVSLPYAKTSEGGSAKLELPAAGTGDWSIFVPGDRVELLPQGPGFAEAAQNGTILRGVLRSEKMSVAWVRFRQLSGTPSIGDVDASLNIQATWTHQTYAAWNATVNLRTRNDREALPTVYTLRVDPELSLQSVDGEALESASLSDGLLTLKLAARNEATIQIAGVFSATNNRWTVPALRAVNDHSLRTRVTTAAKEPLTIDVAKISGLDRTSATAQPGATTLAFQSTGPHWNLAMNIDADRPAFDASVDELFAAEGATHRIAARITFTPRDSQIREAWIALPSGFGMTSIHGVDDAHYAVSDGRVLVVFDPPMTTPRTVEFTLQNAKRASLASEIHANSLLVEGATTQKTTAGILVPPDFSLREIQLNGAVVESSSTSDAPLLAMLGLPNDSQVRTYHLKEKQEAIFAFDALQASWKTVVYNAIQVEEGLMSVDALVRVTPRQGRVRSIKFVVSESALKPANGTTLSPEDRLPPDFEILGPIASRKVGVTGMTPMVIEAVLTAPTSQPFDFHVKFSQPVDTGADKPVKLVFVTPEAGLGNRAIALLSPRIEGEVKPDHELRPLEINQQNWPADFTKPQPADQVLDLGQGGSYLTQPSLQVIRHQRDQALRAVVEVLRERSILGDDGVERNELEIVVQNQSEQYLKIAFPHPKSALEIYDAQVAGKSVPITFDKEGAREVLLLPLIRTGLLEPELTVRVVYTVAAAAPLGSSGEHSHALPEILGGVPVAQSALVLMLPANYRYSNFDGTLDRVELVDLEVDEALRKSKSVEKLSRIALRSSGETQQRAAGALNSYMNFSKLGLDNVKQTNRA